MIWTTGTFAFMPSILALNGVREVMQNLSGNSEIKDRIQGCLENIKPFLEINPGLILIGAKTICCQMPNWPRGCNKVGNEKLPHTDFPAAGFGHCGHKAIWAVCHNVSGRHNCAQLYALLSFLPRLFFPTGRLLVKFTRLLRGKLPSRGPRLETGG